ncbi:MAG: DUF2171 domain-containing protein [Chloroflexota bacterium]|nr:DUF2171 domain-containing protein [Chloroflexota bacterium]
MEQTAPRAALGGGKETPDRRAVSSEGRPRGPRPAPATTIPMGADVCGADGERLGRVAAVWPAYVLVEPAPGSSADYWVPVDAIAGYDGDVLVLTVAHGEAVNRGWTERPPGGPEQPR